MFASVVLAKEMTEICSEQKVHDHFEEEVKLEIVAALNMSDSIQLIRFELSRKDGQFCWKETSSVHMITEPIVNFIQLRNSSYLLATEVSSIIFDRDLN